jgi:hypothetical protein
VFLDHWFSNLFSTYSVASHRTTYELETIKMNLPWSISKFYPEILLSGTEQANRDTQPPVRNSNPEPRKHEAGVWAS